MEETYLAGGKKGRDSYRCVYQRDPHVTETTNTYQAAFPWAVKEGVEHN